MSPFKLWYQITDTGIVFNHLQHGHDDGLFPVPRFPAQNWWPNARWSPVHAWLTDDKPAKVVMRNEQ